MTKILEWLNAIVWGAPALVLILGVGLFLTLRLGFSQLTLFPRALAEFFAKLRPGQKNQEGVSPFQALCTALAATVGTGNLVGVAGAICLGGPGAIFWMWVCGVLGMVTKFAEATLAVRYRVKTESGYIGGPMYVITQGIGGRFRPLACAYCLFGVVAAFGVGNATQINAVITGVNGVLTRFGREESRMGNFAMGLVLAALIGTMLLGGAKRIGAAAERLVPFAALAYILMCSGILLIKVREPFPPGQSQAACWVPLLPPCALAAPGVSLPMKREWAPHPSPTLRLRLSIRQNRALWASWRSFWTPS